MVMSTKCKIAGLAAVAIVIAAPAFAGPRVKPTQHSAFAGAFASSVNPGGAHVDLVQRPANNNLNAGTYLLLAGISALAWIYRHGAGVTVCNRRLTERPSRLAFTIAANGVGKVQRQLFPSHPNTRDTEM
jgi:hypothetical protein